MTERTYTSDISWSTSRQIYVMLWNVQITRLILLDPISYDLISSIRTECAVIGRSRGKPGRALQNDPVRPEHPVQMK